MGEGVSTGRPGGTEPPHRSPRWQEHEIMTNQMIFRLISPQNLSACHLGSASNVAWRPFYSAKSVLFISPDPIRPSETYQCGDRHHGRWKSIKVRMTLRRTSLSQLSILRVGCAVVTRLADSRPLGAEQGERSLSNINTLSAAA